jgi:ubiquinone biosynthesis protein COQ4
MNTAIQAAYHTLALGADFNANTVHVFKLFENLASSLPPAILEQESLKLIQSDSGLKEMYQSQDAKFISTPYDLEFLSKLSEGTLGREYASHMICNNFSTDIYPTYDTSKPAFWLFERANKTHDIWHVVTEFDTSTEGEIALNNFYLAQRPVPDYALINIAGILSSLKSGNPLDIDKMTQAISNGYQRGKQAKSLVGVKWEDIWHRSLSEIRKELNIVI